MSLQRLLENKLVIKVLSLAAAVILWLFVMQEQNPIVEANYTVDLVAVHAPDGCRVTPESSSARLRVRAPRSLFGSMSRGDLKAELDLAYSAEEGKHAIRVRTSAPQGVEVISAKPDVVEVSVEPIVRRQREVSFIRVGTLPDDMTVGAITPAAETVTITGAKPDVAAAAQVVGYVSLTSQSPADLDLTVPLSAVNTEGKSLPGIRVEPERMAVHVSLARGLSKKIVDVKPLFEGTIAEGRVLRSVKVEPSRIEIAGESAALAGIASLDTEPIPIAGLAATSRKSALLTLPPGVTVTNRMVVIEMAIDKQ